MVIENMPARDERSPRLGAYGLCLCDLDGAADLLTSAPDRWVDWRIVHKLGEGRPSEFVEETRARLCSEPDGWIDLDRQARVSTLNFPAPPREQEIVHPYLASTASVTARWQGLQSFHAGAFVAGDKAWGVLGPKGAGKSSLLAFLALKGVSILTDDVLVVDNANGFAGPRCIDLRAEPAAEFGVGEELGVVGTRARWRLRVGQVEPEVPMGGWILLEWGEPGIESLAIEQRLSAIFESLSLRVEPADPAGLMELLALPMFVLRQRHGIDGLDDTSARLLEHVDRLSDVERG